MSGQKFLKAAPGKYSAWGAAKFAIPLEDDPGEAAAVCANFVLSMPTVVEILTGTLPFSESAFA